MAFEVEALLTQSKNENGKVRLNTVFLAVRIRLALQAQNNENSPDAERQGCSLVINQVQYILLCSVFP